MKEIYLIRHAKAEAPKKKPDKEKKRKLTKTGMDEIKKKGKKLLKAKLIPDIIFSSDAIRTMQTAKELARILKVKSKHITSVPLLYESAAGNENSSESNTESTAELSHSAQIINFVQNLSPDYKKIMIVGHNPVLSTIAQKGMKPVAEATPVSLPTGGYACFRFAADDWRDIRFEDAELILQSVQKTDRQPADFTKENYRYVYSVLEKKITVLLKSLKKNTREKSKHKISLNPHIAKITKKFIKSLPADFRVAPTRR